MEPFFTTSQVNWGIIGCGDVTEVKSGPPYRHTEGFALGMVMRRNAEKAQDYAHRHQVPRFTTDAEALINDPDIDAIYIATPPDTHKLYGLMVAEAGKPCCIEKPMAPNYADSLAIHEAFASRKLPLYIAYYRRTLPRFLKVKEWIDTGRIGKVLHLRWQKSKPPSETDLSGTYNWRTDPTIAPGGYFDDLASHGLDLFTHFLGPIKQVSGYATNQMGLYGAYDAITGSWIHENGVTGEGSWHFNTHSRVDEVVVLGAKGEIRFAVLDDAPIELITDGPPERLTILHPKHLHQPHVQAIREHLMGGVAHPSTGATGLHTSWVMDRILGVL